MPLSPLSAHNQQSPRNNNNNNNTIASLNKKKRWLFSCSNTHRHLFLVLLGAISMVFWLSFHPTTADATNSYFISLQQQQPHNYSSSAPKTTLPANTTTTAPAPPPPTAAAAAAPAPKQQRRRRVFVCITGQRERLELDNKVRHLLEPLRDSGWDVHVALLISDTATRYTNAGPKKKVAFRTYGEAHDFLTKLNHTVVTNQPSSQPDRPVFSEAYFAKMDKTYIPMEKRKNRVLNHARQFHALTRCAKTMIAAPSRLQEQQQEQQQGGSYFYDLIIRARDDSGLLQPLEVQNILRLLRIESSSSSLSENNNHNATTNDKNKTSSSAANNKNNNGRYPTVLSSDCRAHEGMNDRLAVVTPDAAYDYFMDPFVDFYAADELHPKVHNPESYLLYTYLRAGIDVVQSSFLRGVVKLDTQSNLHPNENKTHCPPAKQNVLRSHRYAKPDGKHFKYEPIVITR